MRKSFFLVLAMLCLFVNAQSQNKLTQTIRGTVIDKSLQSALPGAMILLMNQTPVIATTADQNGKFKLSQVPVGRHQLLIRFMGYKEMVVNNLEVTTGKETVLTIGMEEDLKQAAEVVVEGKKDKSNPNNALAVVSAQNMRAAEINRFAGSRSDPSRMAANYAGVAGGGDQRNDIIVRGNSPWGVLWRLEGVDIPNPNHFAFTGNTGGAFSMLNNNLLSNSDFLTGAFPAAYGNKTAAVFDVRLRNGNNEKREHTAQIGLNGLEFTTEGPLSKNGSGSYLASGRQFSFKALDKLGVSIGANGIPSYQDGTFKIHLPAAKGNSFTLWGIGGQSSIDLFSEKDDIEEYYVKDRTQKFISSMYAGGLSYVHHLSEKTVATATVSASGSAASINSMEQWTDRASIKAYDLDNREGQILGQYSLTHKWNVRHTLTAGTSYRRMLYNNLEKYYDKDENIDITRLSQKGSTGLFQAWAQWQYRASESLTINPGVFVQNFEQNRQTSLEPRISAVYQAGTRDRFSIASGLHSQTSPLFVYQYRFRDDATGQYSQPNQMLGFMKSFQVVAGYQRTLTENLRLKTEAYYQYLYDVPVSLSHDTGAHAYSIVNTGADYNFYALDSTVNKGSGRNYGVELSLEKFFHKGYYFLANVSLFRSFYTAADGKERSTAFDLGHVANVLAGKEWKLDEDGKRLLSFDVKITHSGGRHFIPVDVAASVRDGKARYDYDNAYKPQVKDYFRTDVKVTYIVNRPKANHNFFIAADNVLNTQNVFTQDWNNKKKEVVTYYQLGVFPYLGYRVQF